MFSELSFSWLKDLLNLSPLILLLLLLSMLLKSTKSRPRMHDKEGPSR